MKVKKRKWILLGIGAVIVLVLALLFALPMFKNKMLDAIPSGDNGNETSHDGAGVPIDDIENDVKGENKQAIYTISYISQDCPSPYLYVYNDNTYEFYDSISKEKPPVPKAGKFDYDILKIAESIMENEVNEEKLYSVRYKDKEYVTSASNKNLSEFLQLIDVDLEKCVKEQ